jgi:aryl-alcohol dehydrogenase-like predicted oxidoreductase
MRAGAEADLDAVLLAARYTLLEQTALDDLLPRCSGRGVLPAAIVAPSPQAVPVVRKSSTRRVSSAAACASYEGSELSAK